MACIDLGAREELREALRVTMVKEPLLILVFLGIALALSWKLTLIALVVFCLFRPVLVLLTLPATLLTLGLFIFVINGLLFWMVASFVDGFHVAGFWSGVIGAIVYGFISWIASALVLGGKGD